MKIPGLQAYREAHLTVELGRRRLEAATGGAVSAVSALTEEQARVQREILQAKRDLVRFATKEFAQQRKAIERDFAKLKNDLFGEKPSAEFLALQEIVSQAAEGFSIAVNALNVARSLVGAVGALTGDRDFWENRAGKGFDHQYTAWRALMLATGNGARLPYYDRFFHFRDVFGLYYHLGLEPFDPTKFSPLSERAITAGYVFGGAPAALLGNAAVAANVASAQAVMLTAPAAFGAIGGLMLLARAGKAIKELFTGKPDHEKKRSLYSLLPLPTARLVQRVASHWSEWRDQLPSRDRYCTPKGVDKIWEKMPESFGRGWVSGGTYGYALDASGRLQRRNQVPESVIRSDAWLRSVLNSDRRFSDPTIPCTWVQFIPEVYIVFWLAPPAVLSDPERLLGLFEEERDAMEYTFTRAGEPAPERGAPLIHSEHAWGPLRKLFFDDLFLDPAWVQAVFYGTRPGTFQQVVSGVTNFLKITENWTMLALSNEADPGKPRGYLQMTEIFREGRDPVTIAERQELDLQNPLYLARNRAIGVTRAAMAGDGAALEEVQQSIRTAAHATVPGGAVQNARELTFAGIGRPGSVAAAGFGVL